MSKKKVVVAETTKREARSVVELTKKAKRKLASLVKKESKAQKIRVSQKEFVSDLIMAL